MVLFLTGRNGQKFTSLATVSCWECEQTASNIFGGNAEWYPSWERIWQYLATYTVPSYRLIWRRLLDQTVIWLLSGIFSRRPDLQVPFLSLQSPLLARILLSSFSQNFPTLGIWSNSSYPWHLILWLAFSKNLVGQLSKNPPPLPLRFLLVIFSISVLYMFF